MIRSKHDLEEYLKMDKKALGISDNKHFPIPFYDDVWRFEIALRKAEYAENCKTGLAFLPFRLYRKLRFHRLSVRYGYTIPLNVFGPGLSIAHYGNIVVNSHARVGKFCRIQEGVNIGASGNNLSPVIGDYVFLGSGAKIIGAITIGNHIAVGAGAVVVTSFESDDITLAGVPAKKVSDNNSDIYLIYKREDGR